MLPSPSLNPRADGTSPASPDHSSPNSATHSAIGDSIPAPVLVNEHPQTHLHIASTDATVVQVDSPYSVSQEHRHTDSKHHHPDLGYEFDDGNQGQAAESSLTASSTTEVPVDEPSAIPADQELDQEQEQKAAAAAAAAAKKAKWKAQAWDIWMKNWFLLGLIIVIILARYFPGWGRSKGPIRPEYSVKYGITSIIFLLSGLSLKTKDLLISAMNYRAHLMVQLTSYIVIPLFVRAITALVGLSSFNATLLAGMAVTSATPTTISSNVVMTSNSGGNESLALFNAAFGNLLGVFISPVIVLILLQHTPETPSGKHGLDYAVILRDLGTTILLPIIIGQVYLHYFPRSVAWAKSKVHFPSLNSACLLILVWTVFCDAFYNDTFSGVTAGEIIAIGVMQLFVFWTMTFFLAFVARTRPAKIRILKIMELNQKEQERREAQLEEQVEGEHELIEDEQVDYSHITTDLSLPRTKTQQFVEPMTKRDTVAILFCGATKSVAVGIPLIKILYSDPSQAALAGLLATPLLIYHVEQLFSGAFMVGWLKSWVTRGEETLASFEKKDRKKKFRWIRRRRGQEQEQEETMQEETIQDPSSVMTSSSTTVSIKDKKIDTQKPTVA
ncbi:hypothetical protein BGZ98_002153 [Dissophora globulifera]|nr:hypothetical protein BGZ98_002153 [Dissophora globulifera]